MFPHIRTLFHFFCAVIHIYHRVRADLHSADHLLQLHGSRPHRGGQSRRSAENMIVLRHRVNAHQSAHGAAGDIRVLPLRKRAVFPVYKGFEGMYQPFHGDMAHSRYASALAVPETERSVFPQSSVVRTVIAFHRGNDHLRLCTVHVLFHAPAFSVCGVLVKKHIMSVEHIQDRIAGLGIFFVGIRKVYICVSFFGSGKLRNSDLPFAYHRLSLQSLFYFTIAQ